MPNYLCLAIGSSWLFLRSTHGFTRPLRIQQRNPVITQKFVGTLSGPNSPTFLDNKDDDDDNQQQNNQSAASLGKWVPVGSATSLTGITPIRVQIMGRNFVVWDSDGNEGAKKQWSVLLDECPHRLAPLSLGRVDPKSSCLECPYHGWQFETNGTLCRIPQLEESQSLDSLQRQGSAKSYPVHLTGDLIWTFLPSEMHNESFPQSLLPEHYFPGLVCDIEKGHLYSAHEMPASMDITVENGIDPSHFPFSHHGVISKRSDAGPMPSMKTVTSNFTHLDVYAAYKRNGEQRERLYSFQRPFLLCTQERNGSDGWRQSAKFFIVPMREGRCRILTSVPQFRKRFVPAWLIHLLVSRLFIGDLFLHDQERVKQLSGSYFQPTSADESSRAWQRWHSRFGFADSPPHTFRSASFDNLPLLTRREQEDQWLLHTHSCALCRRALKQSRAARIVTGVGGMTLAALLRKNHPFWAALLGGSGLLAAWVCTRIVNFHEGTTRASDATDRSWSMHLED